MIILLDEDETTVLYNEIVGAGEKIEGVIAPTKEADANYTYTFSGWVDENGDKFIPTIATKNVIAHATYTATEIVATEFTVLLLDEDKQTILYANTVERGAILTDVETPTKEADAENTYAFSGWVDEEGNAVVLAFISHDITAYATYTATQIEYSLTIYANEEVVSNYEQVEVINGTKYLTSESVVHYGDKLQITVNGTAGYEVTGYISYVNLEKLVEDGATYYVVTGNVTISYTEEQEEYTVMFYDSNKDFLYSVTGVHYGDSVTYEGNEPTKTQDARASYEFDGWVDSDGNAANLKKITGDSVFYANYKETYIEYSFSVVASANSTIAVYKNSEQIYSGSTVHYGDTLTVVVTPSEGYYLSKLYVNGTAVTISSNQASVLVDSTSGVAITYEVEIYKFTVTLYNEDKPTVYSDVEYGTEISSLYQTAPTKESTLKYDYTFICWVDANNKEVTYVKTNLVAYASYEAIKIAYSLTITGYAAVTLEDGATYTSTNASEAELYYGDTFTVTTSANLPDNYYLKKVECENATASGSCYVIDGNVSLTLYITRTFLADAYDNLQVFEGFASGGSVVYAPSVCTLTDGIYFYTYTDVEEIDLTASYVDFTMTALNYTTYTGTTMSHSVLYDTEEHTWTATAGSMSSGTYYADYVSVPLYYGMEVEFTYTPTGSVQLFGLATQSQIDDPATYGWSRSSSWDSLFIPTYNVYTSGSDFKTLTCSTGTSTGGNGTSYASYFDSLTTDTTYTIKLVLGSYLEVYITDGNDYSINLNSYTSGWTIAKKTPYYLTFVSLKSTTSTITSIGYSNTIESMYVSYLSSSGNGLYTALGDSVTKGVGTTWDTGESAATQRYSSVLADLLGMTEENMGISGTVYCEGNSERASRISAVSSISTSSKIVTVLLGTNDFDQATSTWATLGELGSTDTTTIYGALEAMYSALADRFGDSNTLVYICTTIPTKNDLSSASSNGGVSTLTCSAGYTLAQLVEAEIAVAEKYGLGVIDLYNGVDWNISWFDGTTTDGGGYGNNLHPSPDGHAAIAEYMYEQICEDNMYNYVLSEYKYI